jgi:uncharacterized protein (TIRG00374 family)
MKTKVITGLALSVLLVWLSLRGIDVKEVVAGFAGMDGVHASLAVAVMLLMQVFRAIRWGIMLKPLDPHIKNFTVFSITSVGFLAILAIPARLGELARPYLIAKKSSIPVSSALGTIFLERVLDILTVLVIASVIFFLTPLPPWLFNAGVTLFVVASIIFAGLVIASFHKKKAVELLAPVLAAIPPRITGKLTGLIDYFVDGLRIVKYPSLFGPVVMLSLLIWLADALAIHLLFKAFSLNLPGEAPFVLMIVLIAGIAIPVAPGFIGNWHYFCILGLGLFNVAKIEALTFAVVYHALSIGVIIVLGLAFLPFDSFSIADLKGGRKQ